MNLLDEITINGQRYRTIHTPDGVEFHLIGETKKVSPPKLRLISSKEIATDNFKRDEMDN